MSTRRSAPRAWVVKAVQTPLRRMGLELQPYDRGIPVQPRNEDSRRVRLLAHLDADLLLDIGANVGQFALRTRRAGYRGRIVSFEPVRAAFAEMSGRALREQDWECRNHALGSAPGEKEIHVSRNSHSSSLLEIDRRHLRTAPDSAYIGAETVSVLPLDEIWAEIGGDAARPFMKVDVQGFELEVLRGAERSLGKLVGIECELSLASLYEGAPPYRDVIDHLEAAGFRLAGLEPNFWDPETGELLQTDAIFVRDHQA